MDVPGARRPDGTTEPESNIELEGKRQVQKAKGKKKQQPRRANTRHVIKYILHEVTAIYLKSYLKTLQFFNTPYTTC